MCIRDRWSAGCVITEMMLGHPLFPGESGVDQLVEIIKVLGTPTRDQIEKMNPNYTEFKFPQIKAHPWRKVFHSRVPEEAVDLVSQLLLYCPDERTTPMAALMHPFFDDIKQPDAIEKGIPVPPRLFEMSADELRAYPEPVSYTHLTLPTKRIVEISVVAASLKKKTQT
eukprot:TRINITY_DN459_c0_g1_i4.p1 TRINITY_DN459_c0_g1~~TRINITY_DN459_c0_g1_i4.p1  ORF type:complete len:169 (+),score=41.32 TRINITY_DN459_c0_g1_i4:150-656(+)